MPSLMAQCQQHSAARPDSGMVSKRSDAFWSGVCIYPEQRTSSLACCASLAVRTFHANMLGRSWMTLKCLWETFHGYRFQLSKLYIACHHIPGTKVKNLQQDLLQHLLLCIRQL